MGTVTDEVSPTQARRRVAVIGAGISGVCAAGHLLRENVDVTVFERSNIAGGVWHFDPRLSEDPSFPSETPSKGDYLISKPGEFAYRTPSPDFLNSTNSSTNKEKDAALSIQFAPPGPCYSGLKNNVPTSLMTSSLGPWPHGTEEYVTQDHLERYIQHLAHISGVNKVTLYDTRVDQAEKSNDGNHWVVRTVTLQPVPANGVRARLAERLWTFDALVIASGHYNHPRVPDIPGLSRWKELFGGRVIHSKVYRNAKIWAGQTVLVIGAGVSALDVCRELDAAGGRAIQSVRGGSWDIPANMLPESATRVGEIEAFVVDENAAPLQAGSTIPGSVRLRDGTVLTDIHRVVVATGYITSYPFLPHLHSDIIPASEAGPDLLVTREGDMAHNLHKDIFWISDPSLAFIGAPYYIATYSLFDFQAQLVSRVLAGKASMPTEQEMRAEYAERVREKGLGREFHSLRGAGLEIEYVKALVEWANHDAERRGIAKMEGHSEEWVSGYWKLKERMKKLIGAEPLSIE